MNKFIQTCLALCFTFASSLVFAEGCCFGSFQREGFFLGMGASYNTVKFEQNYSATGEANVFDETNTLVATGEAGGPAAPLSETLDTLAPVIQAGYSSCFKCSNNFWGVKFVYRYLDITSTNKLTDTPQAGFLDPVDESELSFTGNVITKSAQSSVNHSIDFLAFTGFSIQKANLYIGIGPSIFETETDVYQAFGFANLDGLPREATGEPVSFSSSKWVWGGTIQLGVNYLLNSCWFIDINYAYSVSASYSNHYSAPFTTSLIGGYTDVGTLFIDTKTKFRAQSLNLTINKMF